VSSPNLDCGLRRDMGCNSYELQRLRVTMIPAATGIRCKRYELRDCRLEFAKIYRAQ